jgi:PTS system mannose-specific IIA component
LNDVAASISEHEMIGIVIVGHGNVAREFIAALEHVAGSPQCISAVCIGADDDMEIRRAEILESAKACNTGDGVIVLTDMFGGTPSNLAISIIEQAGAEVLAGVNLPMLVKLASVRNHSDCRGLQVKPLASLGALQLTFLLSSGPSFHPGYPRGVVMESIVRHRSLSMSTMSAMLCRKAKKLKRSRNQSLKAMLDRGSRGDLCSRPLKMPSRGSVRGRGRKWIGRACWPR